MHNVFILFLQGHFLFRTSEQVDLFFSLLHKKINSDHILKYVSVMVRLESDIIVLLLNYFTLT